MTLEIKNAFEYIAGKVEAQLAPAGYTRQKVAADDKQEIVALFTSENVAYSVVYYKEKNSYGTAHLYYDRGRP